MHRLTLLSLLSVIGFVQSYGSHETYNFPFEGIQLQESDIRAFPSISFGDKNAPTLAFQNASCRVFPGDASWPSDSTWSQLNDTLSGILLKPPLIASVCYPDSADYSLPACTFLVQNSSTSRVFINDPLAVLTNWPEGDTCYVTLNPTTPCTQGAFPVNNNLRLVIKNTGHEFVGRSVGAGSLSIWTHWLKEFEYLPEYSQGEYKGQAARVGAGLEAWEMYAYMDAYNMTLVVPGGSTVGAYGGWTAGGGHSTLASIYGMGSDQVLSLQVVTADGRFITADPERNKELFHALRGGGPGTFGIVTSAVVKAYPAIHVSESTLTFMSGPISQPILNPITGNFTHSTPAAPDDTSFWEAVKAFYHFGTVIVDAGGTTYSYTTPQAGSPPGFGFTTSFELPNKSPDEVISILQPLFTTINNLGINVTQPTPVTSLSWGSSRKGEGDSPGDSRFASRLFPRKNWENETSYNETFAAIRATVDPAGYTFHGIHMAPTLAVGGYPGDNAVNPAFRKTIMHADIFDYTPIRGESVENVHSSWEILNGYMNSIRNATPEAGAYINEADILEPDWQHSFFGREGQYERLLSIKQEWDPWGLFWADMTVGSEGWEVKNDGAPNQNGPLCRVGVAI